MDAQVSSHLGESSKVSFCPTDLPFPQTVDVFNAEHNSPFLLSFDDSLQANGDSSLGKYVAGSVTGAVGDATLFVANHAY